MKLFQTSRIKTGPMVCTALLLSIGLNAACMADTDNKHAINLPPSANLIYTIKARQSGIPLSGEASVNWQLSEKKYSIVTETRAMLVGKILDASSTGTVDNYGLAPDKFVEKRFRKNESITRFERSGANKLISFSESTEQYPITGGEQDRTSATWQLVAMARAAGEKFKAGSEWKMFVAGRRDAEPWTFKVIQKESISTALGEFATIHIIKAPPPDSKDQQLELWLAPAMEWYPVRLRFSDADGDYVEQSIGQIKK
ncbi:DUF3108 domain-containing protein [Undibacterium sp. Jales W-56]|uniref:DUF3108 domain-containing protein n=1 Tax=Undibacterium sp. Jales W-56 TaxID=2897325 RepID=UPI0021D26A85|nr:DUF3108 domain-containing protein [Undibacterium sp. Jales W-56]MCU6435016.1 DUF3108 domain-containing protein [Undibacterium sp. Jales W-56]